MTAQPPYGHQGSYGPQDHPRQGQPHPQDQGGSPTSQDRPSRPGRRRKGLLVGGAAAALLLMVPLGAVAWKALNGVVYTALPGCAELLPPEVMSGVPELADSQPVAGGSTENVPGGEGGLASEPGVLDTLNCEAGTGEEGGAGRLTLAATLYDPDDIDAVESMRASVETVREGYAQNRPGDPSGASSPRVTDWRVTGSGDGGFATFTRAADQGTGQDGQSWVSATYVTGNIRVVVIHFVGESVSEADGLDAVERLTDETAERMPEITGTD